MNGLKPLKQLKQGNTEGALADLSLSAFRRTLRLVIPAGAATVVSWLCANLGLYETAQMGDAHWLLTCTPKASPSWGVAVEDLIRAWKDTWTLAVDNQYDQPQWVLVYFLLGSMMGYMALLITARLSKGWRFVVWGILIGWSFDWSMKLRDRMFTFSLYSKLRFLWNW